VKFISSIIFIVSFIGVNYCDAEELPIDTVASYMLDSLNQNYQVLGFQAILKPNKDFARAVPFELVEIQSPYDTS